MKFRNYLKDRFLYIIIYFISISVVISVMMLDLIIRKEPINIWNIVYSLILSSIFLGIIISIDYIKKKKFYSSNDYEICENENLQYIFNITDNINREYDFLN